MATNKYAKIVQNDLQPYFNIHPPKLRFSDDSHKLQSFEYDIDSIIEIIDDYNVIKSILSLLSDRTNRILSSLYDYDIITQFPEILKKFYGKKVGPVLFSASDMNLSLNDLLTLCNEREKSTLTKEMYLQVFTIGKNATTIYNHSINQYIFAKQTIINKG